MMRAIRVATFGAPEVCQIQSLPIPTLGKGQVLLKVEFAGVNPVDTYIRAGAYAALPRLPFTPGKDAAGTVHSVSDGSKFKVGDRVFGVGLNGAYAEFCAADEGSLWPLPENVSFQQGACIGAPFFTAFRALFQKCHAQPGETVLVHGASGGVGTAAVQMAKAAGCGVFGTAGTEEGLGLVRELGADAVFCHRQTGYLEKIKSSANDGAGVDVVLEMLANANLAADLGLVRANGRIAIIGSRGSVEMDPRAAMSTEATIVGVAMARATPAEMGEAAEWIVKALGAGRLRPVVGTELGLAAAAEAHALVMGGTGAQGNVVLKAH